MNHLQNKRFLLALTLPLFLFLATPVAAQQYGQYGGNSPTTQLAVTKTVKDPATGVFIKDLTPNGSILSPGDQITFRVVVDNGGQTSFGFVDVKDTLPNYLDFVSGNGSYNAQSKEFTYRLDNMTPGKSDSREIVAKVVAKTQLPNTNGVICTVNKVAIKSNDNRTAQDSSQACIGMVTKVAKLPNTGPLKTSLMIFLVIAGIAAVGFTLRKARH